MDYPKVLKITFQIVHFAKIQIFFSKIIKFVQKRSKVNERSFMTINVKNVLHCVN